MIQSYDIQIPAGGTQLLEVGAQIFDFLSSGSAFDQIQVLPEFQQGNVTLKLGQGFDAGKVVNRWFVKNPGATAINGTVVLSTAGFRNFRISGDVNVLDGGKSRTLSGLAMMAYGGVSAVAAQYSRIQLWNPLASGKRVVLEQFIPQSGAGAEGVTLFFSQVALTTTLGNGFSKLAGGAASAAAINIDTTAAAPPGGTSLEGAVMASATQAVVSLREPMVLPPGWGVHLYGSNVNTALSCTFEWYEEPNT